MVSSENGLILDITEGPIVILGTKLPSITSIWIISLPALSTSLTSFPKIEKSADNIEAAIFTFLPYLNIKL